MTVGSNINPNFPIPGVDQSSRGFRDNFATIKAEIENLQSKNIQLAGSLISSPVEIGNGTGDVIIPVAVNLTNIQAAGSNFSVQYNFNNVISGSQIYYNNGYVGIGTSLPAVELDVIGNARFTNAADYTWLQIGSNLIVNSTAATTQVSSESTNVIVITNSNQYVGIGSQATAKFEVWSDTNDSARFNALLDNQDNSIRYTTDTANSTLGLVFEQTYTNRAGGIRLDQVGILSLHAGEDMFANLSNTSRVITILPNHNVGIGTVTPQNTLDIAGNAAVFGSVSISGNLSVGTVPTITGSISSGTALSNLLNALAAMGLIINNTTS